MDTCQPKPTWSGGPAGVRLGGQLEDPRAAAALLWPDAAADDPAQLSLKRIQAAVVPRFKVGCGRDCHREWLRAGTGTRLDS